MTKKGNNRMFLKLLFLTGFFFNVLFLENTLAAMVDMGLQCVPGVDTCKGNNSVCAFPASGGATAYCGVASGQVSKKEDGINCTAPSECAGGFCETSSTGQKVCGHSASLYPKANVNPSPTSKKFEYTLLEGLPGFFNAKDKLTDLPSLILSIYKFGIWTVGIAGLFMLVVGGFMYMASAGNTSTAGNARSIIWDSLIGIVAALGAYLILYVINPDLTRINLNFTPVDISEGEEAQVNGYNPGELYAINGQQLDVFVATSINKINQDGIKTVVTSGLRTVERQQQLIIKNCGGFPATKSCSPPTCLLKNGPSSCPHTTGRAVDIWAIDPSGAQAISQDQCMKNISACFNNQYQKKLITAMKAEGFCVLSSEPWHFEKPKMSSSCT